MTLIKLWTNDAPLVIAHRGASLLAPENTMAAFRLAAELGADAIEFDVKLSRDGIPVIHHDNTLDRTTNGTGKIKDKMFDELKKLDAGSKFGSLYAGESIPSLAMVLIELKDKLLLNIELTNYNTPSDSLPEIVLSCLGSETLDESVLISSFNPLALRRTNKLNPNIRTALLVGAGMPAWIRALLEKLTPHDDLHPHFHMVDKNLIQRSHRSDGRINTWTVNEYDDMTELLRLGVDGIITDDVQAAIRAREEVVSS